MKNNKSDFYEIKPGMFWGMIGALVCLIGAAYFKEDLYNMWLHSGGREEVSFVEMESALENKEECYLCGNSSQSIREQYGEIDMIGVISLNDWYVLEVQLNDCDRDGTEVEASSGISTTFGDTGELTYLLKEIRTKGMASLEITLPDDYRLNTEMIQNHLCQECLDKVKASLKYSKWKNERKEAVPLCLVDLETLEIYSLEDWHRGCMIRDYWVEIEPDKEKIEIKVFSL